MVLCFACSPSPRPRSPAWMTTTNPADGKSVSLIPLGGTGIAGEECDVNSGTTTGGEPYTALVQEVLFGRLNLGRSPVKVLAQQLRDVTSNLASSTAQIQIDEAGRFVWYAHGRGLRGRLTGEQPRDPQGASGRRSARRSDPDVDSATYANRPIDGFLDHAAAALGAAAGKGDLINLDLVVYNNRILNIPNEVAVTGNLPTVTGDGTDGETGEVYIDYTGDDVHPFGGLSGLRPRTTRGLPHTGGLHALQRHHHGLRVRHHQR